MYYRAYLKIKVKIIELPDDPTKRGNIKIRFVPRGEGFTVWTKKSVRYYLARNRVKLGWHTVWLWPRTDIVGKLTEGTSIPYILYDEEEDAEEEGFVVGDLARVVDKGGIVVTINPNYTERKGLNKGFPLTLKASEAVIETCKEFDESQGVSIACELDKKTLELFAKSVEAVEIPKKEPQLQKPKITQAKPKATRAKKSKKK